MSEKSEKSWMQLWVAQISTKFCLLGGRTLYENRAMAQTSLPQPHEQRKLEQLIVKLSKVKPISAKPAPIVHGMLAVRASCTAHSQVFSRHSFSRKAKGPSRRADHLGSYPLRAETPKREKSTSESAECKSLMMSLMSQAPQITDYLGASLWMLTFPLK